MRSLAGLPLFQELKKARKSRGWSQRELGARVALPQSHISRMESGTVDVQLSSLLELVRALDLELVLVPRPALPLVEAVLRPTDARSVPAYALLDEDDES